LAEPRRSHSAPIIGHASRLQRSSLRIRPIVETGRPGVSEESITQLDLLQDRVVTDFLRDPALPLALDLTVIDSSPLAYAPGRLLATDLGFAFVTWTGSLLGRGRSGAVLS
jgi:hypothetical protein